MKSLLTAGLLTVLAGQAMGQLVMGVDNALTPLRIYRESDSSYTDLTTPGVGIRALAADSVNRVFYFSTGTQLWRCNWDEPRSPQLVAAFNGAVTTISQGMAYGNGVLYATQGTGTTNRLYTVDPVTATTTEIRAFGAGDFGGLDFNPTDGKLYTSNDSTTATNGLVGRGVYSIDPPFATGAL
ncbi:MAG: hypothetical protein ACOYN0_19940, partial [Phycisphaerales bacterium]